MKSKKPEIIQVCAYYPPHMGGTENVVRTISEELARRGHRVRVFASDAGHKPEVTRKGNLSVTYLKSNLIANTPIMSSLIARLMKTPKNAIMHIHAGVGLVPDMAAAVARKRNIPYIVHFHLDIGRSGPIGWLLPIYKRFVLKRTLESAATIIVLTDEYRTLLTNTYGITAPMEVIPNGVDKQFFRKNTPVLHKPVRLLYVGRLSTQKQVHIIIKALSFVKNNVHLTLVGEGDKQKELTALVKKLGLTNVTFTGAKQEKELIQTYHRSDIFLLSSEREGLPLVLIEAMAAGLPVIASNVIGTRNFVEKTGILVHPNTPQQFAKKIDAVISKKSIRINMIKKGSMKAKKHTWNKLVNRLEKVYEKIAEERERAHK